MGAKSGKVVVGHPTFVDATCPRVGRTEGVSMPDIRLDTTLLRHPKTHRLRRGLAGSPVDPVVCVIALWCFARESRSDGRLTGLSDDDVEYAAGWTGEPGRWLAAMLEGSREGGSGFLERQDDGTVVIHDWAEHQPWSAGESDRKSAAQTMGKASGESRRKKAYARRHPERSERSELLTEKQASARTMSAHERSDSEGVGRDERSELPSLPVLPLPSPTSPEKEPNGTALDRTTRARVGSGQVTEELSPRLADSSPHSDRRNDRHASSLSDRRRDRSDPDPASSGLIDDSEPAVAELHLWKVHVIERATEHRDSDRIRPALLELRAAGKYRDSGKAVFYIGTSKARDDAKAALRDLGGHQLAAQVVIEVRPAGKESGFRQVGESTPKDDLVARLRAVAEQSLRNRE